MSKKRKKIGTGDVFSIKVSENEYVFGRVLFDVVNQYMKKEPEVGANYITFFNKCFLIETFIGVAHSLEEIDTNKKAVISSFVSSDFFAEDECEIIGNEKIDITLVSFPEVLSSYNSNIYFSVGELSLPIPLTSEEYNEIKVHPSFGSGYWIVVATLDYSNRVDLIEDGDKHENYFRFSDLRSLPVIRKKIYDLAKEDPNQSYYDMALKHGFDLARLY